MSDKPTRETLDAFIDGQLPPDEMTRVAVLLESDSSVRAYVEQQQALQRRFTTAFAPLMAEPVPDAVLRAVRQAPISPYWQLFATLNRCKIWLLSGSLWRLAIPAAVTVSLGLAIGVALERNAQSDIPYLGNASGGTLIAQGELKQALNEQLASDGNSTGNARVGVSFRSKTGEDCRTFTVSGTQNAVGGVACRANDEWVIGAIAANADTSNATSPYEMAGSAMPTAIRATVNQMIAGAPFDSTAERAARARHWLEDARK